MKISLFGPSVRELSTPELGSKYSLEVVPLVRLLFACALLSMVGCKAPANDVRPWRAEDHQGYRENTAAGQAAPPEEGPAQQGFASQAGAALFAAHCASCHGQRGHGDGPSKPPVARLPDFADTNFQNSLSDEEMLHAIREGKAPFMPGFASVLGNNGVRAVLGHVRSLGTAAASAPTQAVPPDSVPSQAQQNPTETE